MVMLGRRMICVVASGESVAPDTDIVVAEVMADASAAAADVESSKEAAEGFERMLHASVGLAASELSASPDMTLPSRGLLPCPLGEPNSVCCDGAPSTVSWLLLLPGLHWKVMRAPLLLLLLPFDEDAE